MDAYQFERGVAGAPAGGTIADRKAEGSWSCRDGVWTSDLRDRGQRNQRLFRTGFLVVVVLYALAAVVLAVFFHDRLSGWNIGTIVCLLLSALLGLWNYRMQARHRITVTRDEVRIEGRWPMRTRWRWDELKRFSYAEVGEQTVLISISQQQRREGKLAFVVPAVVPKPMAAAMLAEAQRHGLGVMGRTWSVDEQPSAGSALATPAAPGEHRLTDERYLGTWSIDRGIAISRLRNRRRSVQRWVYLGSLGFIGLLLLIEGLILHIKPLLFLIMFAMIVVMTLPPFLWAWLTYRAGFIVSSTELRRTSFPAKRCAWGNLAGIETKSVGTNTVELTVRTRQGARFRVATAAPVAQAAVWQATQQGIAVSGPAAQKA